MKIEFIDGQFNAQDAVSILTQMIQIKIKFHENKINKNSSEEDIKFSETKIKRLQSELFKMREFIALRGEKISIETYFEIQ